jgi:zinc transporter ZupT
MQFFAGVLFFSIIVDIFPEAEISTSDENKKEVRIGITRNII